MIVGLTGGIGSGKTTALKIFESLGVPVYQADVEAKKIMLHSKIVKENVINLLGEKSYIQNELNRKYIASKVFNNKNLLERLNNIVHPAVQNHFEDFITQQKSEYLVYENAILFENKNEHICDKIIVIAADLEERISRVVKRDKTHRNDVLNRMDNQWSQEEKIKKADYVIFNNDFKKLQEKIENIHSELLKF